MQVMGVFKLNIFPNKFLPALTGRNLNASRITNPLQHFGKRRPFAVHQDADAENAARQPDHKDDGENTERQTEDDLTQGGGMQ